MKLVAIRCVVSGLGGFLVDINSVKGFVCRDFSEFLGEVTVFWTQYKICEEEHVVKRDHNKALVH